MAPRLGRLGAAVKPHVAGFLALVLLMFPSGLRPGVPFDAGMGGWTAQGLWHRVLAPSCVNPHSGVACMYYGLDGSCTYANGQNQDCTLSSPAVSVPAGNPDLDVLGFWLLYQVQSYDPECQDQLWLEFSHDGLNWNFAPAQDLSTQTDPPGGSPTEGWASGSGLGGPALWQYHRVNLSPFAGDTLYVRFHFYTSAQDGGDLLCGPPNGLQQFLGYAVDDIDFAASAPPLTLQKSVAPAVAAPGDTFTFTLEVGNPGPATATVSVWDTLPAGAVFVAANPGATLSGSPALAQWTFPAVAPGGEASAQLLVQAPASLAPPVDWINTAAAAATVPAGVVLSSQVLAKVRAPVLSLVKSVNAANLNNGDMATYSLVLENDTSLTQSALSLVDQLPSAFSLQQAYPSPTGLSTWNLAPMAPGQVLSFSLWGPVFGSDGELVLNQAQLVQGSTTLAQASAGLTLHKTVQPAVSIRAVYPNPAPSHAAGLPQQAFVVYQLSVAMPMSLDIYTVAGEKVRGLSVSGLQGEQQAAWDLKNEGGQDVASGVYVCRLWSSLAVQPRPQATAYIAVLR
jgi:uncharacterized repeat protein (TIGR01451 family)